MDVLLLVMDVLLLVAVISYYSFTPHYTKDSAGYLKAFAKRFLRTL